MSCEGRNGKASSGQRRGIEQAALTFASTGPPAARGRLQDDGSQVPDAQGHAAQVPAPGPQGPAPDLDGHAGGQQGGQLRPGLDAAQAVGNVRVTGALDQQHRAVAGVDPENVADAEQVAVPLDGREVDLDHGGEVAEPSEVRQGASGRAHAVLTGVG